VVLLLTVCRFAAAQSSQSTTNRTPDISPGQIEVKLVPDKSKVMLGEPVFLSFVVENHSKEDLQLTVGGDYRNRLGRPESFAVTVTDEDGQQIVRPDAGQTMGGLGGPQKLPAGKHFVLRLFLPHWAKIEKIGRYDISAERVLKLGKFDPNGYDLHIPTLDVPGKATSSIEFIPANRYRMGDFIDEAGSSFLAGKWEAQTTISYINDERAIPYLVRALETSIYDMKFVAVDALSKFNSDSAINAIRRALKTTGKDITNTTTRELADTSAEQIRHATAVAISKSPHPAAKQALLSLRHDHNPAIRNTVVQYASKLNSTEAIPILEEMSHDSELRISDEALRYLRMLTSMETNK
jgi:hypothetical protein